MDLKNFIRRLRSKYRDDDLFEAALWGICKAILKGIDDPGYLWVAAKNEVISSLKKQARIPLTGFNLERPVGFYHFFDFWDLIEASFSEEEVRIIQLREKGYSDQEIGEMVGKSQRMINRIRMKIKDRFEGIWNKDN